MIKKFEQFNKMNKLRSNLNKGIKEYLNLFDLNKEIKSMIDYNDVPFNLLSKTEDYAFFEKNLNKDVKKRFTTVFYNTGNRYIFFEVFGIISILGFEKVKSKIPILDDLIHLLKELPNLTGEYDKDLILYSKFNKMMKKTNNRKDSPILDKLTEVRLLVGTRFLDEILKLKEL